MQYDRNQNYNLAGAVSWELSKYDILGGIILRIHQYIAILSSCHPQVENIQPGVQMMSHLFLVNNYESRQVQ